MNNLVCPLTGSIIKEPSTLPCNHVFEKEALEYFLKINKFCPVCNQSLSPKLDFSGLAKLKVHASRKIAGLSTRIKQPKLTDPLLEQLVLSVQTDGTFYNLKITAPECIERRPVAIIAIIDVSGSMGTTVGSAEGGKAFTRLDLVKHVLNVLVASLTQDDYLSLIAFSENTEVLLNLCEMNEENKNLAKIKISELEPTSCTCTSKAIREAYKVLNDGPQNYINSILLLTDGVDTDGEDYLRSEFKEIKKQRNVQFNTFGFGSDLWSHLLQELAMEEGGGIFGYIPDQTMIGTIFINFLANTLLTYDQGISFEIDKNYALVNPYQPRKFSINFGQSRNYLLKKIKNTYHEAPKIEIWKNFKHIIELKPTEILEKFDLKKEIARNKIIEFAFDARLPNVHAKNYEDSLEINSLESFKTEFIQTNQADSNQMQLKLALHYWSTWGAHYIRSFVFSHLYEQCLNFKSPSMQRYKNEKFQAIADELTELFCTLAPPEPTGLSYRYDDQYNSKILVMNNLMDPHGGCILETCKVKLSSGVYKPIGSLRKGNVLSNGAKVICLIKMLHKTPLISIGKLKITPYHPILYKNEWIFPCDLLSRNDELVNIAQIQNVSYVCNLFLDKHHTVEVEGIQCVTLAHGYYDGILNHPYYGTYKVFEEYSKLKGWNEGLIKLKRYINETDENGLVNSIKVLEYYE